MKYRMTVFSWQGLILETFDIPEWQPDGTYQIVVPAGYPDGARVVMTPVEDWVYDGGE
jgi:hypothetical protein